MPPPQSFLHKTSSGAVHVDAGAKTGPHSAAELGRHGRDALAKHMAAVKEKLRRIAGTKKSDALR